MGFTKASCCNHVSKFCVSTKNVICWSVVILCLCIDFIQTSCAPNTCKHGRTCELDEQDESQFTCMCSSQWQGEFCETRKGSATPQTTDDGNAEEWTVFGLNQVELIVSIGIPLLIEIPSAILAFVKIYRICNPDKQAEQKTVNVFMCCPKGGSTKPADIIG